jgi:hypothetical protein
VVSDTDLNNARALSPSEEGADHTRSSAVFLTAAHPKMTEGSDISLGPSKAVEVLRRAGFEKVRNLTGGIRAWSDRVDPRVRKY